MDDKTRITQDAPLNAIDGRVAEGLVGEVWPSAQPGEDAVLCGHVELEPRDPVEARSLQTFRLRYTVGRYGLDDTGAIRVVFRAMGDGQALQTSDPAAPNYVTASSSSGVPLSVEYRHRGTASRPRWKALTVNVTGGYLTVNSFRFRIRRRLPSCRVRRCSGERCCRRCVAPANAFGSASKPRISGAIPPIGRARSCTLKPVCRLTVCRRCSITRWAKRRSALMI